MSIEEILRFNSENLIKEYDGNVELLYQHQRDTSLSDNVTRAFASLKNDLNSCCKENFLPSLTNRALPLTILTDLYFLALCMEDDTKNIFTLDYAEILKNSNFWSKVTSSGLKYGLLPLGFFTLFALSNYSSLSEDMSLLQQISTATTLSIVGTAAITFLSFLFTGTFPDQASQYYNAKQNATFLLQRRFDEMSFCLIKMYFSPIHQQIARALADQLETGGNSLLDDPNSRIYRMAEQQQLTPQEISTLFSTLDQAIHYIKNGQKCRNIALQDYIDRQEASLPHHKQIGYAPILEDNTDDIIDINDEQKIS